MIHAWNWATDRHMSKILYTALIPSPPSLFSPPNRRKQPDLNNCSVNQTKAGPKTIVLWFSQIESRLELATSGDATRSALSTRDLRRWSSIHSFTGLSSDLLNSRRHSRPPAMRDRFRDATRSTKRNQRPPICDLRHVIDSEMHLEISTCNSWFAATYFLRYQRAGDRS